MNLELNDNEELIAEYVPFYLIKVKCPEGKSYYTTIPKWKCTSNQRNVRYEIEKRLNNKIYKI